MKVGQKIFIKTTGNRARHGGSQIIETTVTKVGRKYFEVAAFPYRTKFELATMREKTDYTVNYIAYESRQEIEDENEMQELNERLHRSFFYNKSPYSLDQLRRVVAILEEKS